ncbi:hypothetical protein [uncultured Fibrobacter sp.]|uniref:hypothetical protein n=1 Tax=uncultured Fibrobacter sp. TaxID=261512 RepID=UPI0025D4662D|nr:hypothetical protein [uncultured Fibrobacter sp.]
MPLSIAFRWKAPRIETPREDPNGIAEGLSSIGDAIYRAKQSRRAEEDRQRRIDEEDRQRRLFGDTAGLIRGKADDRARLVQQREQIVRQIAAIKQRIGM